MQSCLKPHSPGTGGTSHELAGDVLGRGEKRYAVDFETIVAAGKCGDGWHRGLREHFRVW